MRQTHINKHMNTIAVKTEKNIKAIKTHKSNTTKYQQPYILFNIFIQTSNNERRFVQISIIIMQLKRMTTQTQITCTIRREQMIKGMTSRANLCKELRSFDIRMYFPISYIRYLITSSQLRAIHRIRLAHPFYRSIIIGSDELTSSALSS